MPSEKVFFQKRRFVKHGKRVQGSSHRRIMEEHGLDDIEEYFDNVDKPQAVENYDNKIKNMLINARELCGDDITVHIDLYDYKEKVHHDDGIDYDEDDEYVDYENESTQVTYFFFYTVSIVANIEANKLKLKYPKLFQNEGEGIKQIIDNKIF